MKPGARAPPPVSLLRHFRPSAKRRKSDRHGTAMPLLIVAAGESDFHAMVVAEGSSGRQKNTGGHAATCSANGRGQGGVRRRPFVWPSFLLSSGAAALMPIPFLRFI